MSTGINGIEQKLGAVTLASNTTGTLALVSSGTLTLAGGNNITLSQAGNAVTISGAAGAAVNGSFFQNMGMQSGVSAGLYQRASINGTLMIFPLNIHGGMPINITANTFNLLVSIAHTSSHSHSVTVNLVVYTGNTNNSLSILNSAQSAWNLAANASNSTFYQGERFLTFHSSQWSSQPVFSAGQEYWLGLNMVTANIAINAWDWEGQNFANSNRTMSGTIGINSTNNTWMGFMPYLGVLGLATSGYSTGLPSTIANTDIAKISADAKFVPFVLINNYGATF